MDVFFQESPEVEIATNKFINVETILQWEDVPLIQVGKFEPAGFSTKFAVYHNDGTKIAVVNGSQIYLTEEGKKAALKMRYDPDLTACELEGRTIFELRRTGAAALKGSAELYAPEGVFIKANDADLSAIVGGDHLQVAGLRLHGGNFNGQKIGIHVTRAGGISIGGTGGKSMNVGVGPYRVVTKGGGKVIFGGGGVGLGGSGEAAT